MEKVEARILKARDYESDEDWFDLTIYVSTAPCVATAHTVRLKEDATPKDWAASLRDLAEILDPQAASES